MLGIISLVCASLSTVTAANAASFPQDGTVTYTVGDSVTLDLGCREANVESVRFGTGFLPDGLTMDSAGIVTGTPTTIGDYPLSGYNCTYNGGAGIGYLYWSLVIRINPIVTPEPILAVHNLNTADCSFYLGYAFPEVPDAGSVTFRVENQAGTVYTDGTTSGSGIQANLLAEFPTPIDSLNTWAADPDFTGTLTGSTPFACGDTISFTIGYQWRGAPVATKTVSGVVVDKPAEAPKAGSAPIQKLINLNNADCQFRILATLPTTPLPGSTKITINSYHDNGPADQLTFTISDQVAAGVLDFTFDPTQLSSGPIGVAGIASEDYQVSTSWECGSPLNVSVEYRDLLNNYWSSTSAPQLQTDGFSVTPTKPETVTPPNSDYSISAGQASVGTCSISVIASLPDEARPIALAITNLENNDWITAVILYDAVSNNGVISANLSFSSKDDIYASFTLTDDNKVFEEETECEGTYRAVIDSPGGILASTLFTLGKAMPTCNAGSTLDQEERSCTPVERGYYTTELNSSTPIACPAGMTTATTASKSVNDCYKPIVQSIVGFKAPKALKFNGTTNLALITNTKAVSAFTVTGPCTAKLANVVTKVKGKKVTTKMLKVTAGKKAGTCSINLTSPTTGKYLELSKAVKIKVSKTGK
jgi:hypothetical protein